MAASRSDSGRAAGRAGTASAGARLRAALEAERPLQVVGAVSAFAARLAERAGFRAAYLSGAGVANSAFGLPDLGLTTRTEVVEEARRITRATALPLLVDADTGFGDALGIARTVTELAAAGAAGLHLEDQVAEKRCGHRPGVRLVSSAEMAARVGAAVGARPDPAFVIVARTDAARAEGMDAAIARARHYQAAGADWIFAEALGDAEAFRRMSAALTIPVLANMTEFGRSPLLGAAELGALGVRVVLYPLSAFRAMSQAADAVYREIRATGSQAASLHRMQTRDELYAVLGYEGAEARQGRGRR